MPHFRLDPSRFWEQLSIPSAVLAEASWYGSIRAGWTSEYGSKASPDGAGVEQFGSRWGIKGTSEVSDGLSAVYKFETRIGEGAQTTDQIYVGLAGGFGTVSMGKLPAAGNVHAGFVDQALWLGSNEGMLANKQGSVISYASPSIGGFSFQVDAQGDSGGKQDKDVDSAQFGATLQLGENAKVGMAYVDRATKGMDTPTRKANAKVADGEVTTDAVAADDAGEEAHWDDDKTAMIVGHYTLGGIGAYLGYGQRKWDTDSKAGAWQDAVTTGAESSRRAAGYDGGLIGGDPLDNKKKTTFFGFHGGIGDTGVNFLVQVRSNKTDSNKVVASYQDDYTAFTKGVPTTDPTASVATNSDTFWLNSGVITGVDRTSVGGKSVADNQKDAIAAAKAAGLDVIETGSTIGNIRQVGFESNDSDETNPTFATGGDEDADRTRGSAKSSKKNTPFVLGVSRSLGGGASIHLEHANTDDEAKHNRTALILKVDF